MTAMNNRCCYCNQPTEEEYDPETGPYFPSYHYRCMASCRTGRYQAADGSRYTTAARAADVSQRLADANHRMSFVTFDVESVKVIGHHTMDREERRRRFWYFDADVAAAVGMPEPVHAIGGRGARWAHVGRAA